MKKIKKAALVSLTVLPSTFSVASCSKVNTDQKTEHDNLKVKDNKTNKTKKDDEIKEMHAQINKIKAFLKQGIDGSKDFTPSQSLADASVQKKLLKR